MICETPHPSRPVPMRRSALHGEPFPSAPPNDYRAKRLVVWMNEASKNIIEPEVEWLRTYTIQMWCRPLMTRIVTVRQEWSRK